MSNFVKKLKGPIAIFGAGGFVGINLLNRILKVRSDVYGLSSDPKKNWRLQKAKIPLAKLVKCDLLDLSDIKNTIEKYKPKTIFNLAAYGAYSKQKDLGKIYLTNFNSTLNLIEELKKYSFACYIHAGSQSEYGLNSSGPSEEEELIPNSHYAISKAAVYYLLKYYGKIEKLPVVHLRLYSVYGPWEESDRLMPVLISSARKGKLPDFVDLKISRDFVYVDDVVEAMVLIASRVGTIHELSLQKNFVPSSIIFGEAFNVASGKKTTIRELAYLIKKLFNIKQNPKFGSMTNRAWDLKDWYGNPEKIKKIFGWKAKTNLEEGLKKFFAFYD